MIRVSEWIWYLNQKIRNRKGDCHAGFIEIYTDKQIRAVCQGVPFLNGLYMNKWLSNEQSFCILSDLNVAVHPHNIANFFMAQQYQTGKDVDKSLCLLL